MSIVDIAFSFSAAFLAASSCLQNLCDSLIIRDAFILATLRDRSRIDAAFNDRARLADLSSRTAILTLPPGTSLSQIQRFGVRATLGGGLGGDNWNIDALTVRAMSSRGAQTILEQSGAPLVRLTGDRREQIWDLRC